MQFNTILTALTLLATSTIITASPTPNTPTLSARSEINCTPGNPAIGTGGCPSE
ncbi:MAG: hypothetical protein M1827_002832, partial [Pycnora praestabilis]